MPQKSRAHCSVKCLASCATVWSSNAIALIRKSLIGFECKPIHIKTKKLLVRQKIAQTLHFLIPNMLCDRHCLNLPLWQSLINANEFGSLKPLVKTALTKEKKSILTP